MFEHIQSLKKKPILLPSNSITQPVTVVEQPTADMVEETVVEKAPTPTKEPESKKQQSITDLFKSAASEVTSLVLGTKKDTPAAPVTKRMPVVVVNEEEDDDEDEEVNVEHVEPTRLKPSETKVDSNRSTPFQEDTDLDSDDKRSDSSKRKRPTASYSNYFLEQHEMKKRKTSPDTSSSTGDLNDVIFDEKYGISMDWESLAEKIVFVGREIKDAPLYCTVLWKDGVKSVHPVDQVRRKRPDLLIDYFLRQIDKH
ncbi:hypothetical protein A0J61_07571 [Choanephora cucurbitarum]|uniref:Chromo shadow domain-containing protein n=1 Tax=Choanephora cucurbitarum TaxID=101091 RepID=A0A1C7N5V5_9FUNG|nr:hypothetical protein A0J61_07571 [Choanephora cucurbitarum]